MKKIVTLCTAIVMTASVWAQSPDKMSYQAVVRNSSNTLVTNASIGMQISILQGSSSGAAVYVETQTPTTNANGLVSIEIGNGVVEYGDFSAILWNDGPYFIKSEIDPTGGNNYTISGISQLLSVPYALHAKTAEALTTDIVETDPVFSASVASAISSNDISSWNNKLDSETDPVFIAWNKSDGITIKEEQISDLKHFTNNDETDPIYSSDSTSIKTGTRSWNSSLAKKITAADTTFWGRAETDPYYTADSSYIKTATRSWNSSLAKKIAASDTTFWGRAETDPYYTADSSYIKTATRSWNSSLAKKITAADTTYWGRAETDPYYTADSSYIKTTTRSWNSSISKGITDTDTTFWNNKTYIADTNGDTKITTEQASDEDIIRMSVAGNETFTADNNGFDFVLPTNDIASNLKVVNSNGTAVFGVYGNGILQGDGSGLSNVKSMANTAGGNSNTEITMNYGWYQNMKSVTFEAPSAGKCFVMASGYVRWESTGWDVYISSILRNADPNSSWDDENEFYKYLNVATDYNCNDSSDQYASYAQHRAFNVGAGTHTFTLWANKYTSSSKVRMDDLNITVLFFPTAGTGTLKSTQLDAENEQQKQNVPFTSIARRPDGSELRKRLDAMIKNEKKPKQATDELIKLRKAVEELKIENNTLRKEKIQTDKRINTIEKQVEQLLKAKNLDD